MKSAKWRRNARVEGRTKGGNVFATFFVDHGQDRHQMRVRRASYAVIRPEEAEYQNKRALVCGLSEVGEKSMKLGEKSRFPGFNDEFWGYFPCQTYFSR